MIQIRYDTDDIVVTIPADLTSSDYVQTFLERLRVDAILSRSAATNAQIRDLAEEIDAAWWARNRERFVGQAGPDYERSRIDRIEIPTREERNSRQEYD